MVRVEFHRPETPDVVGAATWDGRGIVIEAGDPEVRTALERVFRPTPVVTDDASLRAVGTAGEVVLQPGSLEWFQQAAAIRGREAGLVARLVRATVEGGWDPAANYRHFRDQVQHLAAEPA